jgi:phage terminase large subunit-like protein
VKEIAVDGWNATQICTQLGADGFEVIVFGQGFKSMTAPTKEAIALALCGRLRHNGHPLLRWMASKFAVVQDDAGNLKPSKKKSTDRIDGIVALIMALGRAMLRDGDGPSMYETVGLGYV